MVNQRASSVWKGNLAIALTSLIWMSTAAGTVPAAGSAQSAAEQLASRILQDTNVKGGLIVHIGCNDGRLTVALRAGDGYIVQGLDTDAADVAKAREHILSRGFYGKVSVDRFDGKRLPYIDNLVNLLVAEELGEVPMTEVMRVLCPNGVAYVRRGGKWIAQSKARPAQIDEWTHYLHDASNNAVAHDTVVGPPRRMQWAGSPRYARHHDRMSSVNGAVSAGGRVFYIFDEGTPASILAPPKWTLIARDAFNGTILWKRPIDNWFTHLWPLKSGPAQLPRRLVAAGDRVYATLSLDGPLEALDAATGKTVRTYENTRATEEVIFHDGVLFALVNNASEKPDYDGSGRFGKGYNAKFWDEAERKITAIRAKTGDILWTERRRVLPATLAADGRNVVFHDGQSVVCLDRRTGDQRWMSDPVARSEEIKSFYLPILVLYEDVVLFSGGETAGKQTGSWYEKGEDTLTAFSMKNGDVLWTAYHPPSGYRSPEDLLVVNDLVWTGETTSGRAKGVFKGLDPHTGEVKTEFPPDVDIYWFHHRCYRGKATDNYLLMARAGTEFVDVRKEQWLPHHWVRGACLYGVMPANGLLYAPQHPCACYLEAKMYGFNALAPAAPGPRVPEGAAEAPRLERGPAYGEGERRKAKGESEENWPTYRHDAARSGRASTKVPTSLKGGWEAKIGGKLTAPVVAEGKVFVASVDTHTVHAMDAASGKRSWQFTAGARVDSPPTIYRGRVLFGSADGWVYCLRASDGALVWRFRAAPMDQRLMSFEQLESVWPVHGSVLVQDGALYCVAGRSMFLDGGLRLLRLDLETGRLLSETVLDDRDPAANKSLQDYVSWLNMPVGLPDILSSDGRLVYMRSQPFQLDGTRLPLKAMPHGADADRGAPPATQYQEYAHLFSPTGFLDDTNWHRSYWLYGSTFISGWCGYFLAGKTAPAGRILVFDDEKVYGFGRKPQYYRWTTPIEHQLFTADTTLPEAGDPASRRPPQRSMVEVAKSKSLNPAGTPLTVEAWIRAEKPGGVVLARGGGALGYSLYLKGGGPQFAVRANGALATVSARESIVGRWAHLAGVLTAEKELRLYVDGELAATAEAPGLIGSDPQEAMQIGVDDGSCVGDYNQSFAFGGLIDEVRVYHRALSAAEIEKHAEGAAGPPEGMVLRYTFDDGKGIDSSGNGNHGTIAGARLVKGRSGRALRFTGKGRAPSDYLVKHHWTKDLPLFARAMVLAGDKLLVAGPPDSVDEELAFKKYDDPEVQQSLVEQAAALEGRTDARLWVVSVASGEKLAERALDSSPVWDGMAAAYGKVFIAMKDGRVICMAGAK